jgi:hypothetical protein
MATQTTYLVRVNSRFRSTGTASRFQYRFDTKLVDDIEKIELITAQIPRLFGNMYDNINRFSVLVTGSQLLGEVIIPAGQYTATQLAAAISADTMSRFGFEVLYNETTSRFVFDSLNDYTLVGRLLPYIGILDDETNAFVVSPGITVAPYPPTLSGPAEVYLESEFIAGSNCVDSPEIRSPYIPLMCAIDCSAVPYGFNTHYERKTADNSSVFFENLISLRGIDIALLDQFGNDLTLPPNADSDFVFRVYIRTSA